MENLLEKIDDVITSVAAVDGIQYTSDNLFDMPTAYSAFQIDENVEISFEKKSVNGQIYNATMRTEFYLHAKHGDYTKTEFKALLDLVLKAIASTSGFQYISFLDLRSLTPFQLGGEKCRTAFGTVEFLTMETWT